MTEVVNNECTLTRETIINFGTLALYVTQTTPNKKA